MKCLLTRPVEIPFQDSIIAEANDGQCFIDSPERVNIKCGLYLSTSFHPELFSVIPDYAKFFHRSYFSISGGRIRILNCRDIVRTIYCLLSGIELQDDQSDVNYYET